MAFVSSLSGRLHLLVLCAFVVVAVTGHSSDHDHAELFEACNIDAPQRVACGSVDIDRRQCEDRGCCWYPDEGGRRRRRRPEEEAAACFMSPTAGQQCQPEQPVRHACGTWEIDEQDCGDLGCCWDPNGSPEGFFDGNPQCYSKTSPAAVCSIEEGIRESCGFAGISWEQCLSMGCCVSSEVDADITCYKQLPDHRRIICPFLSTLINEGSLPVKPSYTREELQEVTIQAGLSEAITIGHVEGNFMHNPAGVQDIFNMEGAANEHITSTGVHDCPTFYYDCKEDSSGVGTCTNTTLECKLPNKDRFESFFSAADANSDLHLTREELTTFAQGYPDIVDGNPLRVGGSIEGSHQAILEIFGEPRGERISKESLRRIFIDRRFPGGYTFPSPAAP
mmetsp:Transcript_53294/g.127133  ORF Transcript_53294/g.127133 Transcript_53294/m.127133 type:complete len:393 (+) Transcript_53294:84-1262(+)